MTPIPPPTVQDLDALQYMNIPPMIDCLHGLTPYLFWASNGLDWFCMG